MSTLTLLLLGCLLLPVLVVVLILVFMGPRFVMGLWSTLRMMAAGLDSNPSRVTLVAADSDVWRSKGKVQAACRELQEAGFTPVGVWTVKEIPPLSIAGLFDEKRRTYAAVYDMAVVGVWVDLFCLHEDGSGLTVTNAAIGWGMDTQPDREKLGHKGASIAEMLALLDHHASVGSRIVLSPDGFAEVFEAEYARDQDWRLARGGPTPEEIERTAQESGMSTSEKEIAEAAKALSEQSLPEISRACIANHLAEAPMDRDEIEAVESRLVAVHDRLTKEQALALFASLAGEAARELETHPSYEAIENDWELLTPREVFRRLATAMPNPAFPVLQGHVAKPLEADVYLMAEISRDDQD